MAKLNKQFLAEINTVLQEVGLNPIEHQGAEEALAKIISRFVTALSQEQNVSADTNPQPTASPGQPQPRRSRRTTRKASNQQADGKKSPYDYWNERIKAEMADLSSEEYEALKRHLAENNAFYSRNSSEKQLKRTFAIIKSWKEQAGSQIDDSPF